MICGQDIFTGKKVFESFRRGNEEIWLRQILKLSENIFIVKIEFQNSDGRKEEESFASGKQASWL